MTDLAQPPFPDPPFRPARRTQGCLLPLFGCGLAVAFFVLAPELAPYARRVRDGVGRRMGWEPATPPPARTDQPKPVKAPAPPTPKSKAVATRLPQPAPVPASPPEPPLPQRYIPYSRIETARLFSGIGIESRVETLQGLPASKERESDAAYRALLEVKVNVPKAADTLAGLERLNPHLGRLLPGLGSLVSTGRVSDFFHGLYERKVNCVNDQLARLDQLVTKHNFYDCETVLELKAPSTGRRALLVQGDMDVVSDGSDGDRAPRADGPGATFQPFTSYRWKKRGAAPNPFLADRKRRLVEAETEYAIKGLSVERNRQLRATIAEITREVVDLEKYSFLVAAMDPFIVVPGFMQRYADHPFAPRIGDLAVVVHGDRAFPAIVGDAGPSYKAGEASLCLAQAINPRSDSYRRPVSDLGVTYLIFPGSSIEPAGPPDVARIRARCIELMREIGGFSGDLHDWPQPSATGASGAATNTAPAPPTNAPVIVPATNPPAGSPLPSTNAPTPAAANR